MSGSIHTLLVIALLVPYVALSLGMIGLVGYIAWKGSR